jgi:hypothetical protein
MTKRTEPDDTNYFRILREAEAAEQGTPFAARTGGAVSWNIEPDVEHDAERGHWRATVNISRAPNVALHYRVGDAFDSEGAARAAARDWAYDWIARQPVA